MSRTNIPMIINLRQNTNDDSTAFGKYFAEVDTKEPLNLKGFAKHMTSHGKIADYQMCVLVLGQVVDCMTELLSQGQPVKLDGLGTFYPRQERHRDRHRRGPRRDDQRHQDQLQPREHQGRETHLESLQGAVHLRVRLPRRERSAHRRRQEAPLSEEDPAELRPGSTG